MLIGIFLFLALVLVLGGAIFLAKAGVNMCETTHMMKYMVGGYFAIYVVVAVLVAVVIPPIPEDGQVDASSLTEELAQSFDGLNLEALLPWNAVKTVFGASHVRFE